MKKIILLTLAVSITIGVILLVAEWGIGYSDYKKHYEDLIDVRSGENFIQLHRNGPNMTKNALTPFQHLLPEGAVLADYALRTDSNGFIIPSKIHEHADLDIFFMGGSTTECETVKENLRFPYLVGRIMEEHTSLKINSYNAGVGGNNSFHSLNILINKILPLHPDVLVFHHNINDIVYLVYYGNYWSVGQKNAQTVKREFIDMVNPKGYSHFPVIQQHLNLLMGKIDGNESTPMKQDKFSNLRGKTVQIDTESVKLQFKSVLESFISTCLNWDIRPVLMTQVLHCPVMDLRDEMPKSLNLTIPENPFDSIPNPEFLGIIQLFHASFNNIIRSAASVHNIQLIDLEELVPNKTPGYLSDELLHYNDSGSVFVAHLIANRLLDSLTYTQTVHGDL